MSRENWVRLFVGVLMIGLVVLGMYSKSGSLTTRALSLFSVLFTSGPAFLIYAGLLFLEELLCLGVLFRHKEFVKVVLCTVVINCFSFIICGNLDDLSLMAFSNNS